jgi:hypothetical protein
MKCVVTLQHLPAMGESAWAAQYDLKDSRASSLRRVWRGGGGGGGGVGVVISESK